LRGGLVRVRGDKNERAVGVSHGVLLVLSLVARPSPISLARG
jgi:hypothetical protein